MTTNKRFAEMNSLILGNRISVSAYYTLLEGNFHLWINNLAYVFRYTPVQVKRGVLAIETM